MSTAEEAVTQPVRDEWGASWIAAHRAAQKAAADAQAQGAT